MASKASILMGAVVLAAFAASSAEAGVVLADVPAPGVIGLVAVGVVAAIAIARWRK